MRRPISLIVLLSLAVFTAGCTQYGNPGDMAGGNAWRDKNIYSRTMPMMGTFMEIKVSVDDAGKITRESDVNQAINKAFAFASELEKKFSIFLSDSEINALNTKRRMIVSPELFNLVKKAKELYDTTDGEFDVTIAPILKTSGFYKDMPASIFTQIPDTYERGLCANIELNEDKCEIYLPAGVWLDLSGIAKGFIVDRVAVFLREQRLRSYMINAGGDIYCGDSKKDGKWKVGLKDPATGKVLLVLAIANSAVVTSGDYENWVDDKHTGDGLSHIADPAQGAPMKKVLASVTVTASKCADADALATGMMAMGKDKAIALADSLRGVSAVVVSSSGDKKEIDYSSRARDFVLTEKK